MGGGGGTEDLVCAIIVLITSFRTIGADFMLFSIVWFLCCMARYYDVRFLVVSLHETARCLSQVDEGISARTPTHLVGSWLVLSLSLFSFFVLFFPRFCVFFLLKR